jgi:hypothetical protein
VRRFMLTMLTALVGLSTPLAGQGNALTAGLAYTVGSGWQVEGLDFGVARAVHAGPIAALSLTARVGSFIDEGAIIGGARGFVFGTSLAARTPTASIAQLGADTSAGQIGLDFTLEATGYVGSHSPLPVGSPWGGITGLLGLRFGDPNGSRLGLLVGPTVFLGTVTEVRTFLGVRFEAPLARQERHP